MLIRRAVPQVRLTFKQPSIAAPAEPAPVATPEAAGLAEAVLVAQLQAQLGEAIHTALRKASGHYQAGVAWDGIRSLPPGEWAKVIALVIEGLPKITVER
jgi:hypothetical protein